jgi:hypothetical protein
MKRISGGHSSLGADATLLSSHAGGPRTAAADTSFAGQTGRVDAIVTGQPAASPRTYQPDRTSPAGRLLTLTVTIVRHGWVSCSIGVVAFARERKPLRPIRSASSFPLWVKAATRSTDGPVAGIVRKRHSQARFEDALLLLLLAQMSCLRDSNLATGRCWISDRLGCGVRTGVHGSRSLDDAMILMEPDDAVRTLCGQVRIANW